MQARSSSSSDERNVEPASKDAVAEKEKLLREIKELRCIIKQCEWNLQTLRFKDVEEHVTKRPFQRSDVFSHLDKMPNVEIDLQNELYRFAGLYCAKARRDEYVFNFTSTNGEQEDNTQAVQIFIKDKKANLGKWVMPMSIDMNYILSKTPIDELKDIKNFVKSCKRNVDCYIVRQEQFLSLKKHISNMKHCTLQSDMGFKQISLELYGVRDNESDTYINLVIHLLYHSDQARPSKIEVDTIKSKLSDDTRQRLKIWLKKFKVLDLYTAFDKILTEDNSTFTWMRVDDSESPLELNNTSSSDEEDFLTQLQSTRKRSLRKRQKKRELQKKWNERKRQRDNNIESTEDKRSLEKDSYSKAKVPRTESPRRILMRKKKAEKATSSPKQGKINKNLVEETTPIHKPKVKLKQTKLNFQSRLNETINSNTNKISSELKLHNRPETKQSKIIELITSTPLRVNLKRLPLSPNLEINNITSIEVTKKTANKLDESKNSDQPSGQNAQERNRLRSRTKNSPSQVLKPHQRLTRSMAKN